MRNSTRFSDSALMNENKYHTVFNSLTVAIIIIDREGTVRFLNAEAGKYHYLTDTPLQPGVQLFDAIPTQWRDLVNIFFTNLITSRVSAPVEISCTDPEGKHNHIEVKCNVITNSKNEVEQILIEGRDVTPQKIFENKITAIARELGSLIENANALIIGMDARGYITEWNESASLVTGYSKNESYTQKFFDLLLFNENDHPFLKALQGVQEGRVITNYELAIRSKDHRRLTVLTNATPRKNSLGEVVGFLLIGQDITELSGYRRTLEQKVYERTEALETALQKEKQLVEIKNRFVSIASHEFKSPLSSISHHVESLKENITAIDQAEARTRLSSIQSQVKHMSVLLEDVLTIGKNEAGKMQPNFATVELKGFLQKVIEEVRTSTKNTHQIQFDFFAPSLEIKSDEKLLRNIFINLLNNAVKFSPGDNEIFLSVVAQPSWVEIKIIDRGIGIDEKDIEHIFEPFTRGKNVQQIKGTGLGLSIVKKAVESLGGKLYLKSILGEGTQFTIRFNLT